MGLLFLFLLLTIFEIVRTTGKPLFTNLSIFDGVSWLPPHTKRKSATLPPSASPSPVICFVGSTLIFLLKPITFTDCSAFTAASSVCSPSSNASRTHHRTILVLHRVLPDPTEGIQPLLRGLALLYASLSELSLGTDHYHCLWEEELQQDSVCSVGHSSRLCTCPSLHRITSVCLLDAELPAAGT